MYVCYALFDKYWKIMFFSIRRFSVVVNVPLYTAVLLVLIKPKLITATGTLSRQINQSIWSYCNWAWCEWTNSLRSDRLFITISLSHCYSATVGRYNYYRKYCDLELWSMTLTFEHDLDWLVDWMSCGFTSHLIQNRSLRRR